MHRTLGFLSALACVIVACSSRPEIRDSSLTRAQLAGHYEMNRGRASDMIDLFEDGRYVHSFQADSMPELIDEGKWTVEYIGGERVLLEGFRAWSRAERAGGAPGSLPRSPGTWAGLVDWRADGTVRLHVDLDLQWAYVRKSGAPDSTRWVRRE